jgi:hypothetical protein
MKPNLLGPACRKCGGDGYYCVGLPLEGSLPDNRRNCEICGGRGYERIKKNPMPENPRAMTSLERDAACDLLRTILKLHISSPFNDKNPLQAMIEASLQRMTINREIEP